MARSSSQECFLAEVTSATAAGFGVVGRGNALDGGNLDFASAESTVPHMSKNFEACVETCRSIVSNAGRLLTELAVRQQHDGGVLPEGVAMLSARIMDIEAGLLGFGNNEEQEQAGDAQRAEADEAQAQREADAEKASEEAARLASLGIGGTHLTFDVVGRVTCAMRCRSIESECVHREVKSTPTEYGCTLERVPVSTRAASSVGTPRERSPAGPAAPRSHKRGQPRQRTVDEHEVVLVFHNQFLRWLQRVTVGALSTASPFHLGAPSSPTCTSTV